MDRWVKFYSPQNISRASSERAYLSQPLDSVTNTTMGKSKELSIDLKELITH